MTAEKKHMKNVLRSNQCSLPTVTHKITNCKNHFQLDTIDNSVFNQTEFGTPRKINSGKASIMAKSREVKKMKYAIFNPNLTPEQ